MKMAILFGALSVLAFVSRTGCTDNVNGASDGASAIHYTDVDLAIAHRGPYFNVPYSKNVTALVGNTAQLSCRVHELGNRTVSCIRHRDLHLLTSGRMTYTSDQRFISVHNPHTEDWILKIRFPERRDSGIYECQVGTTPPLGHKMYLSVVDANTNTIPQQDDNSLLMERNILSTPLIPSSENNQEPIPDIEPDIDTVLLQTLGEFEPEQVEWGDDLLDEISKRFQYVLLNGLKKEPKEELYKRYLIPKNTPLGKAPILNPELPIMLSESYKTRDKFILTKQDQLGRALTALGRAMCSLLTKTPNLQDVMKTLNDCSQLIADAHFVETYTQRSLVIPLVDKSLVDPLKERRRDGSLFGENLTEMVKNSRGMKNAGNLMQGAPNTHLNWNGPPPTRPRPVRNYYPSSRGGGGPRTRGRRYAAPGAPPAQTPRRLPPPQYPPAQPPPRRQAAHSSRRPPPHPNRWQP